MKRLNQKLLLAAFFALTPASFGGTETLLDCSGGSVGDFTSRGFYVTDYPGSSICEVTLMLSTFDAATWNYTAELEVREFTFDGPLVASSTLFIDLNSTEETVTFPMELAGVPDPSVTPGTTLCFVLTLSGPPGAPSTYFSVFGGAGVDLPDATDPCPRVVETTNTTPPLSTFRREAVDLKITGTPLAELTTPPCLALCHDATAGNISAHLTFLFEPALSTRPDLKLFVTPDHAGTPFNLPLGVWYTGSYWTIFNEEFSAIPEGARYHVVACDPSPSVFNHLANADNSSGNVTYLDHPYLNGNPDARLVVTRDWTIGSTYHGESLGVWYNSSNRCWSIFNQDLSVAMVEGVNFNVCVDVTGERVFEHNTTVGNVVAGGLRTVLDHPRLNDNPSAKIVVAHRWNGTYFDTPLAVLFDSGRWHILRQDGGTFPTGQRFHVLIGDPVRPSPQLEIGPAGGGDLKLWFPHPHAALEHSTNLLAPWSSVAATSPYLFTPGVPKDFFRTFICPDLAVSRPWASIVRRDDASNGRVRITAHLRNLGGHYLSAPGQQVLYLHEEPLGGSPSLVAQVPFEDLAPGEMVTVYYEAEWYAGNEFPPEYFATVGFDPDILSDGNRSNDDCQPANDTSKVLSGYSINAHFD